MSVLYKALARAAKANEAARAETQPVPAAAEAPEAPEVPVLNGAPAARRRRGGTVMRGALLGTVAALAAVIGVLYLFPDETLLLAEGLLGGEPAMVTPRPEPPQRPAPQPVSPPAPEPVAVTTAPEGAAPPPATARAVAPADGLVRSSPAAPPAEETPAVASAAGGPDPSPAGTAPAPGAAPPPQAAEPAPAPPSAPAPPAPPPTKPALAAAPPPVPPAKPMDRVGSEPDLVAALAELNRREVEQAAKPVTIARAPASPDPSLAEAVKVFETPPERRDAARAAFRALLRGEHERALALYDEAVRLDPRAVPVLMGRATALHKLGRRQEARAAYQRLLAVDADNREALTNLLALVGEQAPREALAELARLREAHPGFGPILAQMAQAHARLGELQPAIAHMAAAVELEPGNVLYRYNLAVLQDRAGLRAQAAASYEQVLRALAEGAAPGLALDEAALRARLRFLKGV